MFERCEIVQDNSTVGMSTHATGCSGLGHFQCIPDSMKAGLSWDTLRQQACGRIQREEALCFY